MTEQIEQIRAVMKRVFGFDDFRPGQEETLLKTMTGQPTLAVLPTGAGKTLLYQLPGVMLDGLVVIITPLISLMQDQVDRLRNVGQSRVAALNSSLDYQEQRWVLSHLSDLDFLFTSPETLIKPDVLRALHNQTISLFVIDEAHCISQWGPDFRPEYLLLNQALTTLKPQRLLMLTATATPAVQDDIINRLGLNINQVSRVVESVNRPNIFLAVQHLDNQDAKRRRLLELVTKLGTSGIVYLSSREGANQLAAWLNEQTSLRVAAYHAGVAPIDRYRIQQQFLTGTLDLVVATSAFGMGIDKSDIRYVIHFQMPVSLEAYVQEIGRAGRDSRQALAILLYCRGDEQIPLLLGKIDLPSAEILDQIKVGKTTDTILGDAAHVVSFYLTQGMSGREVVNVFAKLEEKRAGQVQRMLSYVQEDGCRRQNLLAYFGQREFLSDKFTCCDLTNPDWVVADLDLPPVQKKVSLPVLDWRSRLESLFAQPGLG
ncbi:MAG: RecQ family ATP-dependent DNA helicase [Limosilactobacillus gorillae]|uniref:RecQ family ATP-dependent DNA helicase n=1 Tax=Limosilactobacillus gorillae TaxID=1450649 RepID=UPI000ABEF394|nr:RecQ family ATP-dependent DNA helicase [Limosilactobacillus gorillae]MDO4855502.1 RecQ family ATP-dependent DNA helicase [Limosilactobacillus gorillae]